MSDIQTQLQNDLKQLKSNKANLNGPCDAILSKLDMMKNAIADIIPRMKQQDIAPPTGISKEITDGDNSSDTLGPTRMSEPLTRG
jgi:hypothetical protein